MEGEKGKLREARRGEVCKLGEIRRNEGRGVRESEGWEKTGDFGNGSEERRK